MSRTQGLRLLAGLRSQLAPNELSGSSLAAGFQQLRWHGGGVPEYWGKDSPYHGGTDFLGTPKNHLDLVSRRPLSPHVFEIDNKHLHYKMPLGALSSITNRATGVMLSLGAGAAGWIALSGDLGSAIASFKEGYPLLVYPAKFAVSFPLLYHYLAGVRHVYWDHYKYGNMIDKSSPLEVPAVENSSKALLVGGSVLAAALAIYTT